MKHFNLIIKYLTTSSIKDISKKLKLEVDEGLGNDREYLIVKIQDWFKSQKKWHDYALSKILIPLVVGGVFFILKLNTDIKNKDLKLEIDNAKIELSDTKSKVLENNLSLRKMEDQAFKKYDLLKEYFPNGYFVSTKLEDNQRYDIRYPGKWAFDPSNVIFFQKNGYWIAEMDFDFGIPELNIFASNNTMEVNIDMSKFSVLQDISPFEFIGGIVTGVVVLNKDSSNPIFAMGFTTLEIINKQSTSYNNGNNK